ncbi:MAG: dihydroorotase, partial [bacterium]
MTKRILIKNGTISDPSLERDFRGDILVDSGKIKKISEETISTEVDETVDAEGMFIAPGFIDIHVHFRDPGYE